MVRAFAGRLRRAGVPVTLVEEEGMEHVWTGPKLERAIARALDFLDRHLRPCQG
jgi:acetyl esterase/lipase